ncbi:MULTISPECIES: hypothetical protein [Yersinia]|uniref:hypothetical protein n=1 Tax=Yersinia TaxID=629 RepID=UPI000BFC3F73|nr:MULTISPECIES: hypothetical protein [Yersinia]ATM86726.1 hypothetical protein CRN74_11915 [Yersinia frederiksenii]MCB5318087.1 hypothetical protein [Yersinia massiliensis]
MNNIEERIEFLKASVALSDLVGPDELIVTVSDLSALLAKLEAAQFEIKELTRRLETPVPLPKAAYFKNSAENIPFFRAFSVIEAIHKAGFGTVTYED